MIRVLYIFYVIIYFFMVYLVLTWNPHKLFLRGSQQVSSFLMKPSVVKVPQWDRLKNLTSDKSHIFHCWSVILWIKCDCMRNIMQGCISTCYPLKLHIQLHVISSCNNMTITWSCGKENYKIMNHESFEKSSVKEVSKNVYTTWSSWDICVRQLHCDLEFKPHLSNFL